MSQPLDTSRRNIEFVAHSDQGGRSDGAQVLVHKGHAYIGHLFSKGFTVLDVRDPKGPRPVNFIPAPPNTWSLHLQAHEDLLLVINAADQFSASTYADESVHYTRPVGDTFQGKEREFVAGMRVFDISTPDQPGEIGFMPIDGLGLHRMWYVGGRYAYVSAMLEGYTDGIFMVVDLADPTRPEPVCRWWIPGMWRDGGLTLLDVSLTLLDVSEPSTPRLLAHLNWCPPFGGGTHTALPLPDRGLVIVADEAVADNCADQVKYTWVVDVREPTSPVTISTFPTPSEEDYCAKGAHFGPHNLHENRPGSFQSSDLIFATYQNAGVRVFDMSDPFHPSEVAYFVPPPPARMFDTRPNRPRVIQSCDIYVDPNGLVYVTDYNAGLYILEYKGG